MNTDSGNQMLDYDVKTVICDWCAGVGTYSDGVNIVPCCECDGTGKLGYYYNDR